VRVHDSGSFTTLFFPRLPLAPGIYAGDHPPQTIFLSPIHGASTPLPLGEGRVRVLTLRAAGMRYLRDMRRLRAKLDDKGEGEGSGE
jgi:hypothetical protein